MAINFERRPIESAAIALREAIRASFAPLEEACGLLGRVALMRFASAADENKLADQIRTIARQIAALQAREEAAGNGARRILKGLEELERSLRAVAIS